MYFFKKQIFFFKPDINWCSYDKYLFPFLGDKYIFEKTNQLTIPCELYYPLYVYF